MAMRAGLVVALAISTAAVNLADAATCAGSDKLRYAQYFVSRAQDTAACAMRVVDGRIVVTAPTTNPAMSCPDMFAWKLFAEAIKQAFWKGWASDQETWPGNSPAQTADDAPYPLCLPGETGALCCNPDSASNPGYDDPVYKAKHCPYFPGDHLGAAVAERFSAPPSQAHTLSFAENPRFRDALLRESELKTLMKTAPERTRGREIRQSMAEIVFRNKALFDYVFRNNLYNQDGLIDVFKRNGDNIRTGAPYRLGTAPAALGEIDFPVDAVMLKTSWVNRQTAEQMGLRDDPASPYIKMSITSPVTDNNGTILKPGEHWLVAVHISSKDIPNWVWATFEHVGNPGRCDYTGCNDSFGYASPDAVTPGQADNYTRPHLSCDNLPLPSWVFDLGRSYTDGRIRPGLAGVLAGLGIGTTDNATLVPQPADRAWLSYRLKGSQVEFTDSMGNPSRLGNSVVEGGFMASSSCMTCHARAGTGSPGTVPLPLSMFVNDMTDSGYLPGAIGIPVPAWFHRSGQPPTLQVLQTDFVWGFIDANPLQPPKPAVVAAERMKGTPGSATLGAAPQGEAPPLAPSADSVRTRIDADR